MKDKKILSGIGVIDNIFSHGVSITNIAEFKPMGYNKQTADEITKSGQNLISELIKKAKEFGYTITTNGKLLKDEEFYKTKIIGDDQ